jgi:hypothetical protein
LFFYFGRRTLPGRLKKDEMIAEKEKSVNLYTIYAASEQQKTQDNSNRVLDEASLQHEYIPVREILMERNLYQTLTKMKYQSANQETSISSLINEMLKEYLHTYIISKSMVETSVNALTDEQINEASAANAMRYREGARLEHGKPSLDAYLELIKGFSKANKFDMKVSKIPESENHVLIVTFHMGSKFAKFLGGTYRILLQEFADIEKMEITATLAYFEYKPKE